MASTYSFCCFLTSIEMNLEPYYTIIVIITELQYYYEKQFLLGLYYINLHRESNNNSPWQQYQDAKY